MVSSSRWLGIFIASVALNGPNKIICAFKVMFGQNKHDCLKICNQQYIFIYFYAMAAALTDPCISYDCELGYDDVECLFVHKEAYYDVGTNFSILCGESGPSKHRALHFNRPVNKFPPNSSVTFEGGKFSQVTSCHHLANMANNLTHQ